VNASLTPAQTVGPFFHDCLLRGDGLASDVAGEGERICLRGFVYDSDGVGVPDAMLECWQADRFTRVGTDARGAYTLNIISPNSVRASGSLTQAPHVSLAIFARGLLNHLFTRVYFADNALNARDPVLLRVPANRRQTLIAMRDADQSEPAFRFDIVLQGNGETVFFDFK
jgi:protocatechuate 3,4-dioxygenase alpha subunit